jgi:hypothetical protein
MGLLDTLMGDAEARASHEEFANRVTQGAPGEGYSDQEALQHHQQIAGHLSNDEYQHAAMAAFQRMTPEQRQQFRHQIDQRMGQHDHTPHPAQGGGHEPGELASLVGGLHSQNPSMLGNLLGGGTGGGAMDNIGKMALGGIAAMAVKQALQHH